MTPSGQDNTVGTILLTDKEEGPNGKMLANGTIVCNTTSGGLTVMAQRSGGQQMNKEMEVREALHRGHELTLTLDLATCTKASRHHAHKKSVWPRRAAASQTILTARLLGGYRIPANATPQEHAVEFEFSHKMTSQHVIYNIRPEQENKAIVKTLTPAATFNCTQGQGFQVYRGEAPHPPTLV